jgi:hypothetical protein
MAKTEVYNWRLDRERKMALESAARREGMTLAKVLDHLTDNWIEELSSRSGDDAEQARLHAAAEKYAGIFSGSDPFASEKVSEVVRQYITEKNVRKRAG